MQQDGVGPPDGLQGLSRRDALKRGVVLGGAALWTVPAVHVLTITEAAAQQPSGMPPGRRPTTAEPKGQPRGRSF